MKILNTVYYTIPTKDSEGRTQHHCCQTSYIRPYTLTYKGAARILKQDKPSASINRVESILMQSTR